MAIGGLHLERDLTVSVFDVKAGALMLAREEPSAGEMIHQRSGIATRNVDALVRALVVIPHDGNAMRGVFTGEPKHPWKTLRPDVLEPNQTDARYRVAIVKLWTERRGQLTLNHFWFHPKVHQQPSPDDTVNLGQLHCSMLTDGLGRLESAKACEHEWNRQRRNDARHKENGS